MKELIENRIQQLQGERMALADRLRKMEIDIELTRHMISAYDGAIGELAALLQRERPVVDRAVVGACRQVRRAPQRLDAARAGAA